MRLSVRAAVPSASLVVLLLGLFAGSAAAQQTTGKIEGRVLDAQSGQPLIGAQVSVVGTRYGNITNEEGYYFLNNIPAGLHDIQAQYIGYQTVTVVSQRVLVGQSITLNFQMQSQAIALEAITVEGEANPLVPRDQTQTKSIITGDVADAIPVENVRQIVALQPGIVETGDRRGQVVRGGRPGEAAVYLDGVLVRNFNAGAQSEISVQNSAVEEVDVLVGGFGAEYGQAMSGVINLVSRGGGTRFSGALGIETDQIALERSFGYTRLEASIAGPILGEALGFSAALTAIGQEDARPTFMGSEIGSLTFPSLADPDATVTFPIGQTRFFQPTGALTNVATGEAATAADCLAGTVECVHNFEEIQDLGDKKPWNNGDEYNLNFNLRGTLASTRYNLGLTLARQQRRFFDAQLQFRPHGLSARRDKQWLLRGGIEQVLFQGAESGANLRVNVGIGEDEFVAGILGNELADTLDVIRGDKFPMDGDLLGFTFDDFAYPFEDSYTIERWFERFDSMADNPALDYLTPIVTLTNPATGEPWTLQDATTVFRGGANVDEPFGLGDFFCCFARYGVRREKTFSIRGDIDWQVNRWNRVLVGAEVLKKDIVNIGLGSLGVTAQSGVSVTSPTFQNVFQAEPTIAGFYAKDRLDLGEVVVELGARLDMFDSDVLYPEIPGFALPVSDPVTGEKNVPNLVEQETQWQFSPRLGVGFPVTENTQFRLSYGHFTQVPALYALFAGVTSDLNKTNPNTIFGRPIDFGRTVGFEFGFTHSFNPQTVVDISGYTRDKQGDVTFRTSLVDLPNQPNTTVKIMSNADFGYTRGLDVRLTRRFANILNLGANYSYLTSKSTGSDPNTYLITIGRQTNPVTGEPIPPPQSTFATDFDQRHTISASGVIRTPADFSVGNPALDFLLRNLHTSLAFQARSGLPYTKTRTDYATASIGGPDPVFFIGDFQQTRLPWTYIINARVGRNLRVGGSSLLAFVSVRNLLDTKNVLDVFSKTGSPINPGLTALLSGTTGSSRVSDEEIVIADEEDAFRRALLERRERTFGNGDGVLSVEEQQSISIQSFFAGGHNPELGQFTGYYFGEPRQIRLGFEWRF